MNRRKFIKKSLIGGLGLGLLGTYTWQVEPFWLEFVKMKMDIKNLPSEWKGRTIMQISDIHVGNRFDYQFIIDSFQKAQKFQPDLVVYTGDYVSYESKEQIDQLKEVMQYAVLGKMGSVGILGNHDYGKNWAEKEVANSIVSVLENQGIKMLRNEAISIEGLNLLGIDDYWSVNFFPEKVMQNYHKEKANLVLCHNPDVCDLDVWNGYEGWILSGHTHGGQCKPPFFGAPILPIKNEAYTQGYVDLKDGRKLYVNRALGSSFQVRFNVRPEITLFTLG